jgi:hypothetical protein
MLRTDVDEHVLTFDIRLETWRRLERDGGSTVIRYERNSLRSSLCVETGRRELYFDSAL